MEQSAVNNQPVKKAGRINWVVVSVTAVVVAALIFGGGLVASNLLAQNRRGEGGFGGFRPEFQIQAATELPTETATLTGVVTNRTGNMVSVGQRPNAGSTALIEVTVDASTTVYHDTTQRNFNPQQPPSGPIQQTVEPGKVDGISTNSRVTIWGVQNGNQLTAKVLVYTDPLAFRPPQ